ncbi:MAG: FtsX-like permease family protein [Planctomycetota bacterium]
MLARPKRSALLVSAVALSALLIAAVSTAMASIQGSLSDRILAQIGDSDIIVQGRGSGLTIDASWAERAASWEGVEAAVASYEHALPLRASVELWRPVDKADPEGPHRERSVQTLVNAIGTGIDPAGEVQIRPLDVLEGRLPTGPGEIVIDELLGERLAGRQGAAGALGGAIQQREVLIGAGERDLGTADVSATEAATRNERVSVGIGTQIEYLSGFLMRKETPLEIVGIVASPPLGGRPLAFMERRALAALAGDAGQISAVDIVLKPGVDPAAFAEARRAELSEAERLDVLIQTTAKVTSGFEKNMSSGRIGMVFASALAFLAASFIIMTGLTVDVAERQRDLAVLRCVGGKRSQLAVSQLAVGLMIGGIGAVIGTPLGIAACGMLFWIFDDVLQSGLKIETWPIVLAAVGAVISGVFGAAWPAWKASRTSPLRAMASQSRPTGSRAIVAATIAGAVGLVIQLLVVGVPDTGPTIFWGYVSLGLPAMFIGYFVLGVPTVLLIVKLLGPLIGAALGLPRRLLPRTVEQTPFRFGFTAGAMMGGLALMVSIWAHGGSVLRDFLGGFEFPDAFVSGAALTPEAQEKLDSLDFVTGTCAITLVPVENTTFGVEGLTTYKSTFIAFEPEPFFELAELTWVQGSRETALPRLLEGGAVIVAREFLIAKGLGVGDTFTCKYLETEHEFEIVGVVTSPGLDVVSQFFNIGEEYTQQAIHAVFGSRDDMKGRFGVDTINLIQAELADDVDDEYAVETIRRELFPYGILDAGSGRAIQQELMTVFGGALGAFSVVAVCAMVVACFGVANLIVAGIDARRFEFGVLRAVGGPSGVLLRLVIGEAIVIAIAAIALGTAMGFQGAWAGRRMYRFLIGIDLQLLIPFEGLAIGWSAVAVITLLAALPAGLAVMRTGPRELLATR